MFISLKFQIKCETTKVNEATFNPRLYPADEVDLEQQPKIEVLQNTPEWKYVERLIPTPTIPQITPKSEYPSGWKPPTKAALTYPYYIKRSKAGMVPVYLVVKQRNIRKTTVIKHIKGDIWELNREITDYVENYMQNKLRVRVNEFVGRIEISGDYTNLVKDYLISKGF